MARRLALLIGNQGFEEGSGFEPLRGPHNDVDALARVLGDPARGDFAPVEVLKDVPLRRLAQSLQVILRQARPQDEVLIHYSGHGQPDEDGRLFFAAADSHAEHLTTSALRAADLQEWMARSPAGTVILFLDCCFAGAFGRVLSGGLRGAQGASIQRQLHEAAQAASGRFILASSTSWQSAQEAEGEADGVWMGRFTRAVLGRLETSPAATAAEIRFSHLAAGLRGAFPGHDPRAFVADGAGDPLIARVVSPETPQDRRIRLLTAWVESESLPEAVFASAIEAVHGDGPDALVRRVVRLLDTPGMTARAFAAALQNAVPRTDAPAKPPEAEARGMGSAKKPDAPAPRADRELLKPPPRRPWLWMLLAVALPGAAYGAYWLSTRPPPPVPPFKPVVTGDIPKPPPLPETPVQAALPAQPVLPAPGTIIRDCDDVCPQMVVIPAGSFEMGARGTRGAPDAEAQAETDEWPRRTVTVPSIAVGKFEVTFVQWDACVAAGGCGGHRPDDRGWGRDDRPVINVSWTDAQAYVAWLNQHTTARRGTAVYRLLTEAEWEYACRAGTNTPFSFGPTISTAQANYDGNYTYGSGVKGEYRQRTVRVGSLPANPWGLHEMHGNVWEWVEDAYGPYPDRATDAAALQQPASTLRVLRGGSWYGNPRSLRCGGRDWNGPQNRDSDAGFRVARTLF